MRSARLQALIDGKPSQSLPLTDRGFQYGDGLFETIAVQDGKPLLWERHMQRLQAGCIKLLLPAPDPELLWQEARALIPPQASGTLKLIYTAGSSARGYGRPHTVRPRRMLWLSPPTEHPVAHWLRGINIGYCSLRLQPQGIFVGLKHLNRLEQVLARREVDGRALDEGLLLNQASEVIEAVACNVFAVLDGTLVTPPLVEEGIHGVMRDHILEIAQAQALIVEQQTLTPQQLAAADEIFLTNSLIGLWPVRLLEGRSYDTGPVGRRLLRELIDTNVFLVPAGLREDA